MKRWHDVEPTIQEMVLFHLDQSERAARKTAVRHGANSVDEMATLYDQVAEGLEVARRELLTRARA